jgi:glycosyltransferase involved in cell wall biosynthesis
MEAIMTGTRTLESSPPSPDPTTSIVIPCYNLGEFLPEAVESARKQSRPALEVIIVDDGSTDARTLDALRVCERSGVTVLRTPNRGAPAARNHGIRHAKGTFILCLDADDVLERGFLERTEPVLLGRPDVGIVATGVRMFGEFEGTWRPPAYAPVTLLWRNCVPSASLFRRVCWERSGGYPDLPGGQDWGFWIGIVRQGWKWEVIGEQLYRYRRRSGSISQYREANRPEILRRLIALHADAYRGLAEDIQIEMDGELNRLQAETRRLRHGRDRDSARIRRQTAAIEERDQRIAWLEENLASRPSRVDEAMPSGLPPAELVRDRQSQLERARARVRWVEQDLRRAEHVARIAAIVERTVPRGARVLVLSRGDDDLLALRVGSAEHFPRNDDGTHDGRATLTGPEAIRNLEALRAAGAEYLIVPDATWLERHAGLRVHLDASCSITAHDTCLICALRPRVVHHTFSVVICTYRRAAFLERALESVFAQDYPRDRFEIIVVDNDSPDETAAVVRAAAQRSPVPLSYHVEKQNGLSHARNLGVSVAGFEYVAFLDDDATACTGWLAAFNEVINEHHALVVGGRVEHAYPDGFQPPAWFAFPYLRGFFGINYRDRGKHDRVFRIRSPHYIGGGNSAYARRLFDHFGGYDSQLGRDARTLLAAEETYLNRLIERFDLPIWYTDDAVIHHAVSPSRVTRRHLLRKAFWSGISNSIAGVLSDGYRPTRAGTKANRKEVRRLLGRIIDAPYDAENFSRLCRVVYNGAYLANVARLELRRVLLNRVYRAEHEPDWDAEDWVREVESWEESEEKYRQLFGLYGELGDSDRARAALEQLLEFLPATADERDLDGLHGPLESLEYDRLIDAVRSSVHQTLPRNARTLVISRGDDELLRFDGPRAGHFPQLEDGTWAGYHPADSASAIAHLEELRKRGWRYLVVPRTAFWWFAHYDEFRRHLEDHYHLSAASSAPCCIVALDGASNGNGRRDHAATVTRPPAAFARRAT